MAAVVAAAVVEVVVGVAPPSPLLLRVCGPPTSTPRPTLFRCSRVPGGRLPATPPASTGNPGQRPSIWSSITGRAALHATNCASALSLWSATGSSACGSGDIVSMDGLAGSTVADQLLQHHDHGPSCDHRLGSRLRRLQPHHLGCR
jgi:hypothetical protein